MKTMKKQSGLTMSGFIVVAVLLAGVAIFSMKLIPAYMENGKIQNSFKEIVQDPSMQSATIADIKLAFVKRAVIMDDVTSVSQNDIEISKEGDRLTLSASYSKKIPVAGNVSLLIEFSPSAHN